MTLFQYVFTPLCWLLMLASALGAVALVIGGLAARAGRSPRRLRMMGGVAVLFLLSIPFWLILSRTLDPFSRRSFNPQAWRQPAGSRSATRGAMTGDLLRFHLRRGMSTEAVLKLLGPPDMPDRDARGHAILRYRLGPTSGPTSDYLDLLFTPDGRLDGMEVWQG